MLALWTIVTVGSTLHFRVKFVLYSICMHTFHFNGPQTCILLQVVVNKRNDLIVKPEGPCRNSKNHLCYSLSSSVIQLDREIKMNDSDWKILDSDCDKMVIPY